MTALLLPTDKGGLRRFALTLAAAVIVLFWLLLPWLFDYARAWWPLAVGGILAVWGLLAPHSIYPLYRLWMSISRVIGWINTRILLGAVFIILVTPMGLVLRALGKLQYTPSPEDGEDSYRVTSIRPGKLEDPF